MGSKVSIINETNCILNISVKQLFPLYFDNFVEPGGRMERIVGKVWFTVEARVWNNENDYSFGDIGSPPSGSAIKETDKSVFESLPIFKEITVPKNVYQSGSGLIVGSDSDRVTKKISNLVTGADIRSYGWYFDTDRTLAIRGGPKAIASYGGESAVQYLELSSGNDEFVIIEVENY